MGEKLMGKEEVPIYSYIKITYVVAVFGKFLNQMLAIDWQNW